MGIVEDFNKLLANFKGIDKYSRISIKSEEDICKMPFTTRKEIENFKFSKCPVKPASVNTTSGSTGVNVLLYFSDSANEAISKRGVEMLKIIGIDPEVDIALNLFEYGLSNSGRMSDYVCRKYGLPIIPFGVPDKEKMHTTIKAIDEIKPSVLIATYSVVHELFSNNFTRSFNYLVCGGSMATPKFIERIERMAESKIYNAYGCNEVGFIAIVQKPGDEFLELIEDGLYIEVLNDENRATREGKGKIVITDLSNYSMPIIRYVLGDIVEIIKKNGKKYIKIFGRGDNFTNINDSVFSVGMMLRICMDTLSHDKFSIIIDKILDTNKDVLVIGIEEGDYSKKDMIINEFKKVGLYPSIKKLKKVPFTSSGKVINFVDKRKRLLEEKGASF